MSVRLGLKTRLAQARLFVIQDAPSVLEPPIRCDLLGLRPGVDSWSFEERFRAGANLRGKAILTLVDADEWAAELRPDAVLQNSVTHTLPRPHPHALRGTVVRSDSELDAALRGGFDFFVAAGLGELLDNAARRAPIGTVPWFAWTSDPAAALSAGARRLVLEVRPGSQEDRARVTHWRRRLAQVWASPELEELTLDAFRLR